MPNAVTRPRRLAGLLVALLASVGTAVAAAPTADANHADNPYSYNDICEGFNLLEGRTLRIRNDAGNVIGRVQIGINYGNGRACVATIKNHRTVGHESHMDAFLLNRRNGKEAEDHGNYAYYAGPTVLHVRNSRVYYSGLIVANGDKNIARDEFVPPL